MSRKKELTVVLALIIGLLMLPQLYRHAKASSQDEKRAARARADRALDFYDVRRPGTPEAKAALARIEEQLEERQSGGGLIAQSVEQRRRGEGVRLGVRTTGEVMTDSDRAEARLARRLPGLSVTRGETSGVPEIVEVENGADQYLARASGGETRETVLRRFLGQNAALYGLTRGEVEHLKTIAEYTNPARNLSWACLRQEIDGIPVFQGEIHAAFTTDGNLVRTMGNLATGLEVEGKAPQSSGGGITTQAFEAKKSAAEAVAIAAESVGMRLDPSTLVPNVSSPDGTNVVFDQGPFDENVKAELVYFPIKGGVANLAWSMVLWMPEKSDAFYTLVDAETGQVVYRKNITNDQTQTATFNVYNDDSPGPLSPSNASPGSAIQGPAISRTLFTLISELPAFDNLGWITDAGNTTTGNNVDAGLDIAAPNGIDPAGRPIGSPTRVFDFPYNPPPGGADSPTDANYRNGIVSHLFFWANRYHDRLYELGFTEPARNFQNNNFGRGGLGADFVRAEAQDSSGTNNANFATPADGALPRMQMFIFPGPTPDRDGDLDMDVVLHEMTHGTSNRLHNNAAGLNTTTSGGMGEGWSDFYARSLLSTAGEDINGLYPAGAYVTFNLSLIGTDNYYYGIRRFPYALKTTVGLNGKPHNPLTFADTDPAQINTTDGAFPENPLNFSGNGAQEVHNLGEIWSMTLLEMRARIITNLGFATGNQRSLQIVTDGMKLDPINPNMLQGRNAIVAADCAGFGGADELAIWQGFASRGMGFSAKYNSTVSVTEAFDTPNLTVGNVTVSNDSCDNSGHADPGETVTLSVPLTNGFQCTTATGVSATIGAVTQSYGSISGAGTVSQNFTFTVPPATPCGSFLPVSVSITSSVGPIVRTFNLQIGTPTSLTPAVSYSSGNIAVPVPDNTTVDIPIVVPDSGVVGDVNVKVRLNHTFDGDLVMSLIAPDGTTVALANNRGGAGANFGNGANDCSGNPTVFDDSAGGTIAAGVAPFAGSFRPESPLSGVSGHALNGTWKLRVSDTANLDTGTVGCVQLVIQQQLYFCCGVPGTPIINAFPPAVVTAESCSPGNGAADPNETVTMSFPLKNVGTGLTTNLVATLLPGGGVNMPSGPQTYGVLSPVAPAVSRPFSFVATGTCGGTITATLHVQDGALDLGNVTFTIILGTTMTNTLTFSNPAAITIPNPPSTGASTGAPSAPYPSNITVAGVVGTVNKVMVTLTNLNHTFPDDIDVLLVGPLGQKLLLMSDVGTSLDLVNVTLTLDDAAPTSLPDAAQLVTGTFKPTNIGTGDLFAAPAPVGPYPDPQLLSIFNGLNPNGIWSLYVVDDLGGDTGNMAGGWSLSITTADPVCCSSPCVLTCPANITVANDVNQCSAVVNYVIPPISGSCGTVSASPASGSFFPKGTTTVTVTTSSGSICMFTVTVNDTQLPTITCPASFTAITPQNVCTSTPCAVATFTATASDNCPGVTVACTPPSGSCLPPGITTVNCTATDGSGNTRSCSFTVTVFDVCLQDDSDPGIKLIFNSITGDYRFCCSGTVFTGRGVAATMGCIMTLNDNSGTRRVTARVDKTVFRGTASVQSPPGTMRCIITDRDTRNNVCICQ